MIINVVSSFQILCALLAIAISSPIGEGGIPKMGSRNAASCENTCFDKFISHVEVCRPGESTYGYEAVTSCMATKKRDLRVCSMQCRTTNKRLV